MTPLRVGLLLTAVLVGPSLWSQVQAGRMDGSTALMRACLVAAAITAGAAGIQRLVLGYEQEQERIRAVAEDAGSTVHEGRPLRRGENTPTGRRAGTAAGGGRTASPGTRPAAGPPGREDGASAPDGPGAQGVPAQAPGDARGTAPAEGAPDGGSGTGPPSGGDSGPGAQAGPPPEGGAPPGPLPRPRGSA